MWLILTANDFFILEPRMAQAEKNKTLISEWVDFFLSFERLKAMIDGFCFINIFLLNKLVNKNSGKVIF